eukprot:m.294980 g.294980  ORF g.294980 m.294980 type:complete len:154 (+) comp16392_c0_seq4:5-466(+)
MLSMQQVNFYINSHNCIQIAIGVVHMDFYPSNIMWAAKDDGSFDIKIIDWDAAHRESENFSELTQNRITKFDRYHGSLPGKASKEHDLFFLQILQFYQTNEALWSTDKETLDTAFTTACKLFQQGKDVDSNDLKGKDLKGNDVEGKEVDVEIC